MATAAPQTSEMKIIQMEAGDTSALPGPDPLCDHDYLITTWKKTNPISKIVKLTPKKIRAITAIYHCKLCGYSALKKDTIDKHQETAHKKRKPEIPDPCTSCTINKIQTPEGYINCDQCTFFSKTKQSLKLHMKVHLKAKPYKCIDCNFITKEMKELIEHNKIAHSSQKELFVCEWCDFNTWQKRTMVEHRKTHKNDYKPYICGICFFATAARRNLTRHIMKYHEGNKAGYDIVNT